MRPKVRSGVVSCGRWCNQFAIFSDEADTAIATVFRRFSHSSPKGTVPSKSQRHSPIEVPKAQSHASPKGIVPFESQRHSPIQVPKAQSHSSPKGTVPFKSQRHSPIQAPQAHSHSSCNVTVPFKSQGHIPIQVAKAVPFKFQRHRTKKVKLSSAFRPVPQHIQKQT